MTTRRFLSGALLAAAFAIAGSTLAQGPAPGGGPPGGGAPGGPPRGGGGGGGFVISTTMLVESNSFPDGGIIPAKNSMQGGVQPDFKITGIPANAQSVVLIFHDIEIVAGNPGDDNLHWMAWNIPVVNGTAILEEGKLPEGAMSRGSRGAAYMGPGAPAAVRYHHYVFDFYAVSSKIDLPAGLRPEMFAAMTGKVVGKASYIGRFHGEQGAGGGRPGGGAPGGGGPGGGRPGGGGPGAGGPPPGAGF